MNMELRSFTTDVEIRESNDGPVLVGIAPPFNLLSQDLGGFRERFMPGSVEDRSDVVATFQHDDGNLLGRTPGTLRLTETERGLEYEVTLPDTETGRMVRTHVERGDVRGSSFEFFVREGGETIEEDENGQIIRTISKARVQQVGPVLRPSYLQADLALRSVDAWCRRQRGVPVDVYRKRWELLRTGT